MSDLTAKYNDADQLKEAGKHEEAIARLQELLTEDESFVLAHSALAVLYYKTGDAEQSIAHAERACELEPTDAFNFTALSVTYQRAFQLTQNPEYIHKAEEAMAHAHAMGS